MDRKATLALFAFALFAASVPGVSGEEVSPYYFADDPTLKREPRLRGLGEKKFSKDKVDPTVPEYRREHSPLDTLEYLVPGTYEVRITGILCNACTASVVRELEGFPQITSVKFDFEEGILRFKVADSKPEKKGKPEKMRPVSYAKFSRAVKRAGRKVRLDTRFTVSEVSPVK